MTVAGEPSGVLVVRAWYDGDPPRLKARITHTVEIQRPGPETATVSSVTEIHLELDRWLEGLQASAAR
jgi:hypothetical protein